jgi:hypothetical protein
MLCPKIIKVEALDNYKVKLKYETGETKIFNALPYISGKWYEELLDLFDNSVSCLTSLAFFRAKAGYNSAKMLFLSEVVQKLKFPNNSI